MRIVACSWLLLCLAGAAEAAPRVKPDVEAETAAEALAGADVEKASATALRLGLNRPRGATDLLLDALAVGVHPQVAVACVEALGRVGDRRAEPTLLRLAGHRHADVRLAALKVLGQRKGPRSDAAVRAALGDPEPRVRALACQLAGARKDRGAEQALLRLAKKGDAPAAEALGALASGRFVDELDGLVNQIPDQVLLSAMSALLRRRDVGDDVRTKAVRLVGRIPGAASTAALFDYLALGHPGGGSQKLAQKLIDQRSGNVAAETGSKR